MSNTSRFKLYGGGNVDSGMGDTAATGTTAAPMQAIPLVPISAPGVMLDTLPQIVNLGPTTATAAVPPAAAAPLSNPAAVVGSFSDFFDSTFNIFGIEIPVWAAAGVVIGAIWVLHNKSNGGRRRRNPGKRRYSRPQGREAAA